MSRSLREIIPDRLSPEEEQRLLGLVDEIKKRFHVDEPVRAKSKDGQEFEDGWMFKYVAVRNDFDMVDPKVLLMNRNEDRIYIDPDTFLEWQK